MRRWPLETRDEGHSDLSLGWPGLQSRGDFLRPGPRFELQQLVYAAAAAVCPKLAQMSQSHLGHLFEVLFLFSFF